MDTLTLVRHGATAWNDNGYCQGRRDLALSERGREQIALLRGALELRFDRVFASPLTRARETAALLGYDDPEIVEDLTEIDRGHWEGHDAAEIKRRWGKLHKGWYEDPRGLAMPGGEAFDDLWERAQRALERIEASGGRAALVCAHKATNRVILARALGRPSRGVWAIPQPQACVSILRRVDGRWQAERIGDVAHLPEKLVSSQ